jgi:flagella basal body P-ring formation protein FlgA
MDRLTRWVLVLMTGLCASVGLGGPEDGVAAGAGGGVGVTTVSLRGTVRLAPDAALTLGAIAEISGGQRTVLEALSLPATDVAPGRWAVIEAGAVRELIESSHARGGSVVVEGARVNLTRLAERVEPAPAVQGPEVVSDGVVTLRDHLLSWLRARHAKRAEDIRVVFDARDDGILRTPTAGRVVEVNPIGTSERPAVRVTVYEADRIVLNEPLRFGVEILVRAPVLTRPLRRGERVGEAAFEVQSVWTDPANPPVDPAVVAGQSLRRDIGAGQVLRFADVEPSLVIRRGDEVSVRTVRGSVVVKSTAIARQDAALGEMVELQPKDRSSTRFFARAAGDQRAVMIDEHRENNAEDRR